MHTSSVVPKSAQNQSNNSVIPEATQNHSAKSLLPKAAQSQLFIQDLAKAINLGKKEVWHNNNHNMEVEAYIKYIKNLDEVSQILLTILELKKKYNDRTFTVIATAGCQPIKVIPLGGVLSEEQRKKRMEKEYRQSFSLSSHSTGKASLYLKVHLKSQEMKIKKFGDEKVLRVTGGVAIEDGEKFLHKRSLALIENQTTIQKISLVGASGTYGPSRYHTSMTTNVVKWEIVTPLGKEMTLSETENPKLFKVLRDCHLGLFYIKKAYIRIQPQFLMKRRDQCFTDFAALNAEMNKDLKNNNLLKSPHFIAMLLPVDIKKTGDHFPRVRITTFERTNDPLPKKTKTEKQELLGDYVDLMETETGEGIIAKVTNCPDLRKHFPFIVKSAAIKTFGFDHDKTTVNYSHKIAHIFRTYTDLPIEDINFLIEVNDLDHARDIFLDLFQITESTLIAFANDKNRDSNDKYPLLNAFARLIKGLYFPKGEGGVAPTGVDEEGHYILSFEFVTYHPLQETPAFKELVSKIQDYLKLKKLKVNFHPGKHFPDNVDSLPEIYTGEIKEQRLKNVQGAVLELHDNSLEEFKHSPMLSAEKKFFIGMADEEDKIALANKPIEIVTNVFTDKQKEEALKGLLSHAKQYEGLHEDAIKKVEKHLNNL